MNRNMKQWVADQIASPCKKALPILSFPCVQLMNVTVRELVSSSQLQAEGMKQVADRVPSAASVSLMDLSVEAEAFGSTIHINENEVPTVVGALISDEDEAAALKVPQVGAARTGICVDAIALAAKRITDRPILSGVIGPYSLAGRLLDVSEAMLLCYDDPDMVHTVLDKATTFLIAYCKAFHQAGADGVVLAEPLAGLLSPSLAREFSHPYVKRLIDAVQQEDFCVIYHNCGNNVPLMAKDIYQLGASGYHFGDAIDLKTMLPDAPSDALVMGNVSPAEQFLGGTPDSIMAHTKKIMADCIAYPNFVISSGCDIPPSAPWENIDSFFRTVSAQQ